MTREEAIKELKSRGFHDLAYGLPEMPDYKVTPVEDMEEDKLIPIAEIIVRRDITMEGLDKQWTTNPSTPTT